MSTLTPAQLAALVLPHAGGSAAGGRAAIAVAVALAESGGRTEATNENRNAAGRVTSTDRGVWQINSRWHPEVSEAVARDPLGSTAAASRISRGFADMSPWAAFNNGAYRSHIAAATAGVKAAGYKGSGGGGLIDGLPDPLDIPGVEEIGAGSIASAKAAVGGIEAVGSLALALTQRSTWLRVLYVVGGLGAVVTGALLLNKDTVIGAASLLPGVGGVAAKAADAVT